MRRYTYLLALLLMAVMSPAQKLTVEGMILVEDDQSAVIEKKTDMGDNPCALVKVQLALEGASFGGNVIPPVNYRDGVYWVYMTEGSYLLQVKHPQFQPLMVNFRDYNISKLVPLKTYRLSFPQPQIQSGTTGTLKVSYSPEGTIIYLDGQRLGLSPVIKKEISPGPHKVVIKKKYYPTERKDITVEAGQIIDLTGALIDGLRDSTAANQWTARGVYYEDARGKQGIENALACYRRAADMGDSEAMVYLGHLYNWGRGIRQDDHEALKWYRKAADLGDADGQMWLGNMYSKGQGVPQNFVEATAFYRKAAEQNHAMGQRLLGLSYLEGEGVKKDPAEAVEWLLKSAEQEDGGAQYYLGMCYEKGYGVQKDKQQAIYWYRKGHENNWNEAGRALFRLEPKKKKK